MLFSDAMALWGKRAHIAAQLKEGQQKKTMHGTKAAEMHAEKRNDK